MDVNFSITGNKKRKEQDQDLFKGGEICQSFFFNLTEPVSIKDKNGHYQRVNKSFREVFDLNPEKVVGKTDAELFSPDVSKKMSALDKVVTKGKTATKVYRRLTKNTGDIYSIHKIPLYKGDGSVYAIGTFFTNITKEEEVKSKLLKELNTDNLTGLKSKKFIIKKINQFIKEESEFGILHLDFNQFKLINDSLGHTVGDKVLKRIATMLNQFFDKKEIISRLTGDEFAIVIKGQSNIDELSKLSQKIINHLSQPFKVLQNEIFISLSIGVVTSQIKSESATDYLRDAEIALNKAKKLGRGRFKIFDKKMHTSLLQQWNLESELQKAYKNKDFEIFFQPIYSTKNKKIYSFETLMRWNHPRFGYIAPNKFLQAAEDIGIINPLDRWVMSSGSARIRELSEKFNHEFNISVNLSPMQFALSSLPGYVKEVLKKTRINASCLHLEITENALLSDIKSALRIMNSLKELGVKLTLDDFGTGFASLSYLRKLPIDTLKIDKSFIKGLTTSDQDKAVIKMLINLTKELNLKVIAEGVETKKEFNTLSNMGCDLLQGYYISRPLRGTKIEKFITDFNSKKIS